MSKRTKPKGTKLLPPLDPLQRYSVAEACKYLRISRARFYKKLEADEISILKDGGRTFVAGEEIVAQSKPARRPQNLAKAEQTVPATS
jgi:excisionase family DNA binding protein